MTIAHRFGGADAQPGALFRRDRLVDPGNAFRDDAGIGGQPMVAAPAFQRPGRAAARQKPGVEIGKRGRGGIRRCGRAGRAEQQDEKRKRGPTGNAQCAAFHALTAFIVPETWPATPSAE